MGAVSVHTMGMAPRSIGLADPFSIPIQLSTNCGAAVAISGRIKTSVKVKPAMSTSQRLNRR